MSDRVYDDYVGEDFPANAPPEEPKEGDAQPVALREIAEQTAAFLLSYTRGSMLHDDHQALWRLMDDYGKRLRSALGAHLEAAPPDGPWEVHDLRRCDDTIFWNVKLPFANRYVGDFETEAEAIKVRDALNRLEGEK